MSKYTISIILICSLNLGLWSQEESNQRQNNDSIIFQEKYGLRLGADLSKLAKTTFDNTYSGFELVADYRLSKRIYIAGEIGFEEKKTSSDFLKSSGKGSYFKAGIDYNLYRNWLGMENIILSGARFGLSTFSQRLEGYSIYDTNSQTWGLIQSEVPVDFSGLTAAWIELVFGIKAEVFNNLFLGINVQLKGRLAEKTPNNFENLFIPGFGRTYDSSAIGTGINYTISYLLPIYKKEKKVRQDNPSKEE